MYQKILVAIDNSETSDRLFAEALDLARATQSALLLVHSLSGDDDGGPLPLYSRLDSIYWAPGTEIDFEAWRVDWNRYETASLERLQRYSGTANATGVPSEFRQLVGNPGKVLCTAAHQWNADLIILGNRGRSGLAELVLGSVSNYVLHHAPCSVLVIKAAALTAEASPTAVATTAD
jgi:nucleotide-binding universal stress UspA family protein